MTSWLKEIEPGVVGLGALKFRFDPEDELDGSGFKSHSGVAGQAIWIMVKLVFDRMGADVRDEWAAAGRFRSAASSLGVWTRSHPETSSAPVIAAFTTVTACTSFGAGYSIGRRSNRKGEPRSACKLPRTSLAQAAGGRIMRVK